MSSQINTRKPTGRPAWPIYLVEGPEKSGKTYLAAQLTTSDRFSRRFWVDWGEGAADEYAALPGADYEVIVHDGTFESVANQIHAVHAYARQQEEAGAAPVLLIIDSMTAEWDQLKDRANNIAMSSPAAKRKLEKDPGADVLIPMHAWNTVSAQHGRLMRLLMTFPGMVVMTARGKEVAAIDENGRPTEGVKDYKVEGHKNLAYDASCVLRLSRERAPQIIGMRSIHHGIRPGVDKPQPLGRHTLESLAFDVLLKDGSPAPRTMDNAEPQLATRAPSADAATPEADQDETPADADADAMSEQFTAMAEETADKVRMRIPEVATDNLSALRSWTAERTGATHPVLAEIDAEMHRRAQEQEAEADSFDWEAAIEEAELAGNVEDLRTYVAAASDARTRRIAQAALNRLQNSQSVAV